jgi:hypothetical protein
VFTKLDVTSRKMLDVGSALFNAACPSGLRYPNDEAPSTSEVD